MVVRFDFCLIHLSLSLCCAFPSNSKSPDESDPLNQWPEPLALTRIFVQLQVHFPFTRFNWVECGSTPNPIQPDPWTPLNHIHELHHEVSKKFQAIDSQHKIQV